MIIEVDYGDLPIIKPEQDMFGIGEQRLLNVMNMFHAAVAPEIRTPRDAARYINAITITWPAVEGEVDLGDFIAIEVFRLFQPSIYRAVRDNQALVCEATRDQYDREKGAERLDAVLLSKVPDKQRYRDALMRLFPRLESIWGNTIHGGSFRPISGCRSTPTRSRGRI